MAFCITVEGKVRRSKMSNCRIQVKEHTVFDGNKGWSHNGKVYRLAVGGNLSLAPNGDILCTWLSGTDTEPAVDNCVLMARSSDSGKTWSEPLVWIPAGDMAGAGGIMQYPTDDGRLIAHGAHWPSDQHYTVWHYFRMESGDSGYTWSSPEPVKFREADDVCLGVPIRLENGEYLFPASVFQKRDRILKGPVYKLAYAADEEEALAIPEESGCENGDKFATHLHGCCIFKADKSVRTFSEGGHVNNRPLGLLEPTVVKLKDGRLVMFMRAEWGGFLWRAESHDNGKTWSKAYQTDIPNPTSLPFILRLADGRIALLHNDCGGIVGKRANRDKLSLWISDDELNTWSIKAELITGGWYLSYPNAVILKDGSLVFGYDHNRREVRFVEVLI